MKRRSLRAWLWLTMTFGGATMFQACTGATGAGNYGWQRFMSNSLLSVIDWCYVLDCQNGFFGGLIDPCNDPSAGAWLLDCTNAGGGTTNGNGTTNGTTNGGTQP